MAAISISGQFGAGAWRAGRIAAKHPNYQLVDNRILNTVAEDGNVSFDWIKLMEKSAKIGFFALHFRHYKNLSYGPLRT